MQIPSTCQNVPSRLAFSLVELVVVIAILGLIAGGGMLLLSGQLQKARLGASIDAFVDLHQKSCRGSVNSDVPVRFDFEAKTVTMGEEIRDTISLPGLDQVIHSGAVVDRGDVTISYSSGGPPEYAILLSGRGRAKWIMVYAATGIALVLDAELVDASQIPTWQAAWAHTY